MKINKQYLDKYLKMYSKILLYSFIICISIPIILYIINPTAYFYETTVDQDFYSYEHQVISHEQEQVMKNKINKYMIIGSVCIIGITFSNVESRNKIIKLFGGLNETN